MPRERRYMRLGEKNCVVVDARERRARDIASGRGNEDQRGRWHSLFISSSSHDGGNLTLQEVIDAESRRGTLKGDEIHLDGVDTRRGLLHHEWAFVRRVGLTAEHLAVVMAVELSPAIVHVLGDVKIMCRVCDLRAQDLELSRWLEDGSYSSP